ncbi:MAG: site-2 protease family protein [Solirubrobacterales bacterium]
MPIALGLGLVWYAVFVISTTFHEAAHGLTAWKLGDSTAHDAGLATLDPVPHMQRSPIGMIAVPIVTFLMTMAHGGWMIGWASTPYDPYWAQSNRKKAVWMALAGPAANLVLLLLAGVIIRVGVFAGWFTAPLESTWTQVTVAQSPGLITGAAVVVSVLFSLNLILLIFNLLPLPPLDGSELIMLFLGNRAADRFRELMAQPVANLIGLVLAWNLMDIILGPAQTLALNLLYPGAAYQ